MNSDHALVKAVAEQLPDVEDDDEQQLSLLDEPETESGQAKVQHLRRGPGRPPGSRNKRTERMVQWLLSHHRDPRERLLAVTDMHPADLAALLGCKMLEAVQEQRLCAQAVLPFIAQRQPLAIDVTNRSVVYLTINEGGQVGADSQGIGLTASILDLEPLSDDPLEPVGRDGVGRDDQAIDE